MTRTIMLYVVWFLKNSRKISHCPTTSFLVRFLSTLWNPCENYIVFTHSFLWFIYFILQIQGDIEDTYIVTGPYGYLRQCPNLSSHCPTCGEFNTLQDTIQSLMDKIDDLKLSVSTVTYIGITWLMSMNILCGSSRNVSKINSKP